MPIAIYICVYICLHIVYQLICIQHCILYKFYNYSIASFKYRYLLSFVKRYYHRVNLTYSDKISSVQLQLMR